MKTARRNRKSSSGRVICFLILSILFAGMTVPAMAVDVKIINETGKSASVSIQYVLPPKTPVPTMWTCVAQSDAVAAHATRTFYSVPMNIGEPAAYTTVTVTVDGYTFYKYWDGADVQIPVCLGPGSYTNSTWRIKVSGGSYSVQLQ